jgi:hypothetical protein
MPPQFQSRRFIGDRPTGEDLLYTYSGYTSSGDYGERKLLFDEDKGYVFKEDDRLFMVIAYDAYGDYGESDDWKNYATKSSFRSHFWFDYGVFERSEDVTVVFYQFGDIEDMEFGDFSTFVEDYGAMEAYLFPSGHGDRLAMEIYMGGMQDCGFVMHRCIQKQTLIGCEWLLDV